MSREREIREMPREWRTELIGQGLDYELVNCVSLSDTRSLKVRRTFGKYAGKK